MIASSLFAQATGTYPEAAMTQIATNQCSGIKLQDADHELNRVYQKIRGIVLFLKRWLTGIEEGNICGGSRMQESTLKAIMNDAQISK